MPKVVYDRSPQTLDFDMVDLPTVGGVEVLVDTHNKVWINVNGKCLFRAGHCSNIQIEDQRRTR